MLVCYCLGGFSPPYQFDQADLFDGTAVWDFSEVLARSRTRMRVAVAEPRVIDVDHVHGCALLDILGREP